MSISAPIKNKLSHLKMTDLPKDKPHVAAARIEFEKTIRRPPYEKSLRRLGLQAAWPGMYGDPEVQVAWEMFQAGAAYVVTKMRDRRSAAESPATTPLA